MLVCAYVRACMCVCVFYIYIYIYIYSLFSLSDSVALINNKSINAVVNSMFLRMKPEHQGHRLNSICHVFHSKLTGMLTYQKANISLKIDLNLT